VQPDQEKVEQEKVSGSLTPYPSFLDLEDARKRIGLFIDRTLGRDGRHFAPKG